jgi:uroporphyrinogen-III synthase
MTGALFALRPEPGLAQTLAAGRALGLEMFGAPLFGIEPVAWHAPDPAGFDALLAGSANTFRHGGSQLARLARLPVHAVGGATAQGAREAGFAVERIGEGELQAMLDADPEPRKFLRLAGERHVAVRPPAGVEIATVVVYRSVPRPIASELAERLREGGVVLLHSGEAAAHFARECDRLAIDRAPLAIAALAPRIAEAAGQGWRRVATAAARTDGALLALARDMWQERDLDSTGKGAGSQNGTA